MACNKQKINKHDKFSIFESCLEMVISGILKADNYLYYKYGLFMGMEDKSLSRHYPCHTDMITSSLSAHKHSILHFLQKLKKTIKACGHWGLYKYLTRAMRKRGEDRMDPFAMDFDGNKEMTDNEDFSIDMTPEYMFQKFELVLFLLADRTADLISPQSQLRLQDKLNISDASVFRIQQELGAVGGNDKRLVLYKMFVGLLQDVGMLNTRDLLRSAYSAACDYNKHYKKVVQNMHSYMGLSEKRDADWIVSLMLGRSEALPSDLYMKCKFFEEEGGDLPRSESHSDGEEEEREEPLKSDGDSQGVVQGCTPVTASAC